MNDDRTDTDERKADDQRTGDKKTDRWTRTLREHDVLCAQVNTTKTVWDTEHTEARDMTAPVTTPGGVSFRTVSYPVKHDYWDQNSSTDIVSVCRDIESVLRELGYSDEQIAVVVEQTDGE